MRAHFMMKSRTLCPAVIAITNRLLLCWRQTNMHMLSVRCSVTVLAPKILNITTNLKKKIFIGSLYSSVKGHALKTSATYKCFWFAPWCWCPTMSYIDTVKQHLSESTSLEWLPGKAVSHTPKDQNPSISGLSNKEIIPFDSGSVNIFPHSFD